MPSGAYITYGESVKDGAFYSKDFLINDHVLNLVVNNNFKINRKVIDKEFVKMQIARKTAEKNMHS